MSTSLAALLIFVAAGTAAAHDYPIKPVEAVLRVEPDRVVADVDSDSIYWIEEVVGLHPMPPRAWPADALAKTEAYVNAHLRLTADGKPLAGTLIAASYVQRPWEVNEQGRFHLRMAYPPVASGAVLAGRMDFFEEFRRERLERKEPILPIQDFRGRLEVRGRVSHDFDLVPGAYDFSFPADDARAGAAGRFLESARAGAVAALNSVEGWAALAALALSLAPGGPTRKRAAGLLAAAAVAAAPWPGAAPVGLEWAAGAVAAAAAGRWLGASSAPWLEAASAAALARAWSAQVVVRLPRAAPGALERAGSALGLLAAGSAVLALGIWAASADRRALTAVSESRAAELFERRRRLAATVLLLACGYGFFGGRAG